MAEEYSNVKLTLRYLKNGVWHCKELDTLRPADSMYEVPVLLRECSQFVKMNIETEVRQVVGTVPKMYFIDQEGDWVLLDGVDSYVEAMKDAKKTDRLIIVAEEPKPDPVIPASVGAIPSAWFFNEMQKMKTELKKEILSELGKTGASTGTEPIMAVGTKPVAILGPKSEPAKGDYISRALKIGGGLTCASNGDKEKPEQPAGGAKPKKMKGDYICRALKANGEPLSETVAKSGLDEGAGRVNEAVSICGVCGNNAGEPYFMCLSSECMAMICHNCEAQHPTGHAMLRLPKQLDGGRRFAASTARMILLTMKSSKQPRKKHEKKGKEEKALKKMAKEAGYVKPDGKRTAECVTIEVSLDDAGNAVVTWMIINTGKKQWDKDVKLLCLASTNAELKPAEWEVSVPLLKPGEDAFVSVKMTAPKCAGEYKTFWILIRRGKRFADLSATVTVPSMAREIKELTPIPAVATVEVEHSYALQQNDQAQDSSPISETFERIDYHESSDILDEEGSLISGITECKSAAVEQEYDLIPGNCDDAEEESMEEVDERDSSYVSIASPVVVDDSPDTTNDLTEMWQRLSISLSSLTAQNNSDTESGRLADADMVVVDGTGTDAELLEEHQPSLESSIETVEERKEQPPVEAPAENQLENMEAAAGNVVAEQEESHASEAKTNDGLADSEMQNKGDPKSLSSSRSNSFDSKRHQLSETVSNALSNALLTTTQTLATVGATAKEIHTMATAIVRTNFHTHHSGKESWQPPRAWVPKATQTTWAPAESKELENLQVDQAAGYNPFAPQLTQLTEMGFCELEKNERLLRENHGNLDRVVLILLDEKNREMSYV